MSQGELPPGPEADQAAAWDGVADPGGAGAGPTPARGGVSWRSLLLGVCGVVFICGLTPYNDYALNNTFLVGNNLPIGAIMLLFVFTVLVNGPLLRWRPGLALSAGEVAVAFSMTLVSCGLPGSGLMRYFPASLVGPFYEALGNAEWTTTLERLGLPRWIFPAFAGTGPRDWRNDPVVMGYVNRWTYPGPVPYAAWLVPAATWGVFLAALYGALLCLVVIVRRQWYENERLPFPLAQIYLSLIEPPERGRALNAVLRRKSFWVAFAAVFLLHAWNGMHRTSPKYFVEIPVWYDLNPLLSERPWSFLADKFKDAAVFFTVVGVTYFLTSSVAFSLWGFFVLMQVYRLFLGATTGDPEVPGVHDWHFGGVLAFALTVFWIGRHHWWVVAKQFARGARPGEPEGRYLSYRAAAGGLLACLGVMVGWLMLAGANLPGAVVAVFLLVTLFMVITRIIAEAGLVHGQLQVPVYKPWTMLGAYGVHLPVPLKTFYLTSMLQAVHHDFREVVPVYASHGLKLADETMYPGTAAPAPAEDRRAGRRVFWALALAIVVGYGVSLASMLATEYHYSWTKDATQRFPINEWGSIQNPRAAVVDATLQYARGQYAAGHSPAGRAAFGFAFTLLLGFLRLRFAGWPLHPIGFLMLGTFPGDHLWLSIFIGWLAKALIVRLGGTKLYLDARPLFVGLIVGESAAAAFWLVVGVVLSAMNVTYSPVLIMPG